MRSKSKRVIAIYAKYIHFKTSEIVLKWISENLQPPINAMRRGVGSCNLCPTIVGLERIDSKDRVL